MSKARGDDKELRIEKDGHAIILGCGLGEEDTEKIREKVLLKIGEKLEDRSNVVMTRLNDEDLVKIDALVEIEAFKSRSEAAAFFIKEGINARKDLFENVMSTVQKIRELKEQAKRTLTKE